jgi:hypothetical protein
MRGVKIGHKGEGDQRQKEKKNGRRETRKRTTLTANLHLHRMIAAIMKRSWRDNTAQKRKKKPEGRRLEGRTGSSSVSVGRPLTPAIQDPEDNDRDEDETQHCDKHPNARAPDGLCAEELSHDCRVVRVPTITDLFGLHFVERIATR